MRTFLSVLLLVTVVSRASADDGARPVVVSDDDGAKGDRTLVVTVFGKPLYLEELTPAEAKDKRQELPRAEFDEWLRAFRGARAYDNVMAAVRRKYMEREKIDVTKEEFAAVVASVERQLKSEVEPQDSPFTPEERRGIRVAWQRASLIDWKVCKSLYERYGGRVGMGSLGAWIAFDGQNALLQEHHKAGDIEFHHAELEKAFWERTTIKNFADAYPKGERLKRLLATPPYLWGQLGNTSADKAKVE